jgi:hypothetical protein
LNFFFLFKNRRFFHAAAIGSALLVFPALIFLGWFDAAIGSIVPLIMLAIILASLEYTDPDYAAVPNENGLKGQNILVVGGNRGIGLGVVKALLAQVGLFRFCILLVICVFRVQKSQ